MSSDGVYTAQVSIAGRATRVVSRASSAMKMRRGRSGEVRLGDGQVVILVGGDGGGVADGSANRRDKVPPRPSRLTKSVMISVPTLFPASLFLRHCW